MPKRKSERSKEERWRRKLKRYEDKLKKSQHGVIYPSDEEADEGTYTYVVLRFKCTIFSSWI